MSQSMRKWKHSSNIRPSRHLPTHQNLQSELCSYALHRCRKNKTNTHTKCVCRCNNVFNHTGNKPHARLPWKLVETAGQQASMESNVNWLYVLNTDKYDIMKKTKKKQNSFLTLQTPTLENLELQSFRMYFMGNHPILNVTMRQAFDQLLKS